MHRLRERRMRWAIKIRKKREKMKVSRQDLLSVEKRAKCSINRAEVRLDALEKRYDILRNKLRHSLVNLKFDT